ncbi:hypothetical protein IWX91DRAFT_99552 [Phyllosticta citricarpa]
MPDSGANQVSHLSKQQAVGILAHCRCRSTHLGFSHLYTRLMECSQQQQQQQPAPASALPCPALQTCPKEPPPQPPPPTEANPCPSPPVPSSSSLSSSTRIHHYHLHLHLHLHHHLLRHFVRLACNARTTVHLTPPARTLARSLALTNAQHLISTRALPSFPPHRLACIHRYIDTYLLTYTNMVCKMRRAASRPSHSSPTTKRQFSTRAHVSMAWHRTQILTLRPFGASAALAIADRFSHARCPGPGSEEPLAGLTRGGPGWASWSWSG